MMMNPKCNLINSLGCIIDVVSAYLVSWHLILIMS